MRSEIEGVGWRFRGTGALAGRDKARNGVRNSDSFDVVSYMELIVLESAAPAALTDSSRSLLLLYALSLLCYYKFDDLKGSTCLYQQV